MLENKSNTNSISLDSLIWKGNKVLDEEGKYVQSQKRLVDMTEEELNNCYNHCKIMLFNQDPKNPGRYVVLNNISEQVEKCGAELLLRYIEINAKLTRFTLLNSIRNFKDINREALKTIKPTASTLFNNVPKEFENISIDLLMDGCLDRLGVFNKKNLTRTFILKQGIWLTPTESEDLIEYDESSKVIDRLIIIRERLNIKDVEKLSLNAKGLNYSQMRAMLNIRPNKKYTELTTLQLETLRNRILFSLEEDVKKHINSWENRMKEIELVAEYKNFKIK